MSVFKVAVLILSLLMCSLFAEAASGVGSAAADEFSAKAFLEDLMVRRYTQSLGTIVDKTAFSLGVQLQLMDAPKPAPKVSGEKPSVTIETPTDLLVGTLDPEKLVQQYAVTEEKEQIVSLLSTKKLKSVLVSVGLREDLGKSVKDEVEKWLSSRLNNEFGKMAKSEVTFVKEIPAKIEKKEEPAPKQWFDWLNQFQHLAGEGLMAITLLIGIILWRFTTTRSSVNKSGSADAASIKLQAEGQGLGNGSGEPTKISQTIQEQEDRMRAQGEVRDLSKKLTDLIPKVSSQFESIVRSWCQGGNEGLMKLVCFAEAVGKDVGRLPIPADATKDVAKIFAQMADLSPKEKALILEKTYWDLVSVINLGPEILVQPFGYLAGIDTGVINKVLIDQNPKMKTLVSLYLPDDVRRRFMKTMSADQKMQLLDEAAKLTEVRSDELSQLDSSVKKKVSGADQAKDVVALDMTLEKIASSLNVMEELQMLSKVQGLAISAYKRKNPSLAFLHEWPDNKLSLVLGRISTDQAVAYLRVEQTMTERFISLSSPMFGEVLRDELNSPDKMKDTEKLELLQNFAGVLIKMVQSKEVDLTEFFEIDKSPEANNVIGIRSA